jgi:hypothetical protein
MSENDAWIQQNLKMKIVEEENEESHPILNRIGKVMRRDVKKRAMKRAHSNVFSVYCLVLRFSVFRVYAVLCQREVTPSVTKLKFFFKHSNAWLTFVSGT